MSYHNLDHISESEQMYLITIARLIEDGETQPIPLSDIARKLALQPVSVNQMVRKLEGEGLVIYHPYKGVELTSQGQAIAFRTLRSRRLWEVFLVEHLSVSLEEADTMACAVEHVTPEDIAQRLSNFLDDPAIGPGGQPIPNYVGEQIIQDWVTLTQLEVGMQAQVAQIEAQPEVNRFLLNEGLRSGSEITLSAIGANGSRLIDVEKGFVEVSALIADTIRLVPPTTSARALKNQTDE